MAFITADRVKDTSTTTGTGNITVSGSAPFGYRTFSTVLSVGDTFYYCIQGQGTAEWEVGLGTYASTNQFARTTVLASSASGSAVSFSSGTKNVFITLPANKTLQFDASGSPTAGGILYGTGSMLSYSAVGTAGQALVSGGTGAPTWATITGLGTVTSVNVSGGTTGLTTSGGPVTTSGTITLAGTLAAANGGTGLTSPGTNGNVLTSNGSAWVSQAPSGGSGTSISNGTSNVTIASSNGAITMATAGTTAMTIDTSQNVGIGTSSPAGKLQIETASGTATRLRWFQTGVTNYEWQIPASTDAFAVVYSGTTERMRIDSSGNLLVGTTSATNTPSQGMTLMQNTNVGNIAIGHANGTANGNTYMNFCYNGTQIGTIFQATTSSVTYQTTSDYRLKENVQKLNNGLSTVLSLNPVSYAWKRGGETDEGFIAHELQQYIPNAVSGEKDDVNEDGSIKPQGVDYSKIVVHLVAALQELSAKNDALEARLAALEAK
jgi:hypothetical protein